MPSNWYVRFMPQTTKVCHQKLKCQQEQRQGDREELGRGTQCPLLLPAAAGVLGPLSLLSLEVSLQLLLRPQGPHR